MSDLLDAAKAVDALWTEPDPGDRDEAEGLIWLADYEEDGIPLSLATALRRLRVALRERPPDPPRREYPEPVS